MATSRYDLVQRRLRALRPEQQVVVAGALADLVKPVAALSGGAVEEPAPDDEPGGWAWFPFRAEVARGYAAQAPSSPADGVVDTFRCVLDVLDALDDEHGEAGHGESDLVGDLTTALEGSLEPGALVAVHAGVVRAVDRLVAPT